MKIDFKPIYVCKYDFLFRSLSLQLRRKAVSCNKFVLRISFVEMSIQ